MTESTFLGELSMLLCGNKPHTCVRGAARGSSQRTQRAEATQQTEAQRQRQRQQLDLERSRRRRRDPVRLHRRRHGSLHHSHVQHLILNNSTDHKI